MARSAGLAVVGRNRKVRLRLCLNAPYRLRFLRIREGRGESGLPGLYRPGVLWGSGGASGHTEDSVSELLRGRISGRSFEERLGQLLSPFADIHSCRTMWRQSWSSGVRIAIKLGIPAMVAMVIGGTAYAAMQHWRHVMPEVVVDMRTASDGNKAPDLMIVYGERGSDPFRNGPLKSDQRISQCQTVASRCVSRAARKELGAISEGPQSLQIRLFNGDGNPIIGGLHWTGSWHPEQMRVTCDLRVTDVRSACAISRVTI